MTNRFLLAAAFLAAASSALASPAHVQGPPYYGSPVVVSINQFASAIVSVKWKGIEYINACCVGAALQSDYFYGDGFPNPTEGGASTDTTVSTSKLLSMFVSGGGSILETKTQMAFWQPVDGVSLSDAILDKTITVGWNGMPNVIRFDLTFELPQDYEHYFNEVLTGYLFTTFNRFFTYEYGTLSAIQLNSPSVFPMARVNLPIIVQNPNLHAAVGVLPLDMPDGWTIAINYRAFSKWSLQIGTRYTWAGPIAAGNYSYSVALIIGSVPGVEATMDALTGTSVTRP